MAKPKRGKVIRISEHAWSVLSQDSEGTIKETVDAKLNELHDLTVRLEQILRAKPDYFILPQSKIVCDSLPEARGEAILRAVKQGKTHSTEEPLALKVL